MVSVGLIFARERGLPLVLVAPSALYLSKAPSSVLMVARDSTLKTAAKPGPVSVSPALSLPPSAPVEALTPPPVMPAEDTVSQKAPTVSAQAKATTGNRAMPPLEARMQLTAMGLQYYNQEQFLSAIERGDALAIELFMLGGGVNTDA